MKKIVLAGLFAIGLIALSQQHASAWVNSRFGVGLNWDFQSGGNQFLWGAWRNGQPPGPEGFGHFGGGHHQHYAPPHHGYAPMPQPAPAPQGFAPGMFDFAPQAPSMPYAGTYYSSPYQLTTHPRPTYYYYYPSYYYGQ